MVLGLSSGLHSDEPDPSKVVMQKIAIENKVTLHDGSISESSGLARCNHHPDWFWTHNDSGDEPRVFLVDSEGETRAIYRLPGAGAIDWEDMTSFESDGHHYLLTGDIGGNAQPRKTLSLYLFEEPAWVDSGGKKLVREITDYHTLTVSLSDSLTDYESLAVDPKEPSGFLVEKTSLGGRVYRFPIDLTKPNLAVNAKEIGRVEIPMATSCDIAADGSAMVILSYFGIYVFERTKVEDGAWEAWEVALRRPPKGYRTPTFAQVEAICFGESNQLLWLTHEKVPTTLWQLRRQ